MNPRAKETLAAASERITAELAVIDLVEGNLRSAAEHLERALSSDGSDPGIWLNLGLTRHLANDTLGAQAAFKQGIARSGGLDGAAALLGLRQRVEALDRAAEAGAAHRVLLLALRAEISRRVTGESEGNMPEAPRSGTLGDKRGASPAPATVGSALKDLLYWKE